MIENATPTDQNIAESIPLEDWINAYQHMNPRALTYIILHPKEFTHPNMAEAAMIVLSDRGDQGIKTLTQRLVQMSDSDLADIIVLMDSADHTIDNDAAEEIRYEWDQRSPGEVMHWTNYGWSP